MIFLISTGKSKNEVRSSQLVVHFTFKHLFQNSRVKLFQEVAYTSSFVLNWDRIFLLSNSCNLCIIVCFVQIYTIIQLSLMTRFFHLHKRLDRPTNLLIPYHLIVQLVFQMILVLHIHFQH